MNLEFAVYSPQVGNWVYVQLLFEFSVSDQVIFTKYFQQFRTDIYETDQEKQFYKIDVIRLVILITISIFLIIEAIYDICQDCQDCQGIFKKVVKLTLYLLCFSLFIVECSLIASQTPTEDILSKSDAVIDFEKLVDSYKSLYYVQAINLILLICFTIPFFQYLLDIQSTLNVIKDVGSLILLFGALWWAFAIMFAFVITNTWGY